MITVNDLKNRDNFFLMAGPCAIEGEDMASVSYTHLQRVGRMLKANVVHTA